MRESEPQGKPIDVREWEDGRSEGHPVMGWIGVAPTGNITPRESGRTSTRSPIARESEQATKEGKQMTGRRKEVRRTSGPPRAPGAPSHGRDDWNQIDWEQIEQDVNRLQVRIAKAAKEGRQHSCCRRAALGPS